MLYSYYITAAKVLFIFWNLKQKGLKIKRFQKSENQASKNY